MPLFPSFRNWFLRRSQCEVESPSSKHARPPHYVNSRHTSSRVGAKRYSVGAYPIENRPGTTRHTPLAPSGQGNMVETECLMQKSHIPECLEVSPHNSQHATRSGGGTRLRYSGSRLERTWSPSDTDAYSRGGAATERLHDSQAHVESKHIPGWKRDAKSGLPHHDYAASHSPRNVQSSYSSSARGNFDLYHPTPSYMTRVISLNAHRYRIMIVKDLNVFSTQLSTPCMLRDDPISFVGDPPEHVCPGDWLAPFIGRKQFLVRVEEFLGPVGRMSRRKPVVCDPTPGDFMVTVSGYSRYLVQVQLAADSRKGEAAGHRLVFRHNNFYHSTIMLLDHQTLERLIDSNPLGLWTREPESCECVTPTQSTENLQCLYCTSQNYS